MENGIKIVVKKKLYLNNHLLILLQMNIYIKSKENDQFSTIAWYFLSLAVEIIFRICQLSLVKSFKHVFIIGILRLSKYRRSCKQKVS